MAIRNFGNAFYCFGNLYPAPLIERSDKTGKLAGFQGVGVATRFTFATLGPLASDL